MFDHARQGSHLFFDRRNDCTRVPNAKGNGFAREKKEIGANAPRAQKNRLDAPFEIGSFATTYEADIPAEQAQAEEQARLSGSHAEEGGTQAHLGTPPQGAKAHRGEGLASERRKMPRFPKAARLLCASEFAEVKRKGRRVRSGCIAVAAMGAPRKRLGIVAARHVGTAVVRNRLKRVIREFFRLHAEAFPCGDCVVIPSRGAGRLSNEAVRAQLSAALERL